MQNSGVFFTDHVDSVQRLFANEHYDSERLSERLQRAFQEKMLMYLPQARIGEVIDWLPLVQPWLSIVQGQSVSDTTLYAALDDLKTHPAFAQTSIETIFPATVLVASRALLLEKASRLLGRHVESLPANFVEHVTGHAAINPARVRAKTQVAQEILRQLKDLPSQQMRLLVANKQGFSVEQASSYRHRPSN